MFAVWCFVSVHTSIVRVALLSPPLAWAVKFKVYFFLVLMIVLRGRHYYIVIVQMEKKIEAQGFYKGLAAVTQQAKGGPGSPRVPFSFQLSRAVSLA